MTNNSQKSAKVRVNMICCHLGIQIQKLASELGLERQTLYNIKNEISEYVARKIVEKYPQFRYDWVFSGSGDMLVSGNPSIHAENSAVAVNNSTATNNTMPSSDLMELVKSQQRTIENLTEQNKLLTQLVASTK